MIVHMTRDAAGFVSAMGHRVALHLGGEPELKRRVLARLAQLDDPPDEVRFERPGPEQPAPDHSVAPEPAETEPAPERKPAPPRPPPPRRQKGKP